MRTTLTLEPDVPLKLKRVMAQKKIPLKRAVNEALRAGLEASARTPIPKFKVKPHHSGGFQPGIDPNRLNQLVDELQVEEFLRKASRS
jgi:hypothetical protein